MDKIKTAIMQPYFFPYIGYFQLINAADKFVIYDNIEYTKKGWINRNRILGTIEPNLISLPLKKDSDYLNISERYLSENWMTDKIKMSNKIKEVYRKAPYFDAIFELVQECLYYDEPSLFSFIFNSLKKICVYLRIETEFIISSDLKYNSLLKGEDKVIEICKLVNTQVYLNPIGGLELYSKERFAKENIVLNFLKSNNFEYQQFGKEFVPWLSIIDVLMFNSIEEIQRILNIEYKIV